jgi:hypothetical protein
MIPLRSDSDALVTRVAAALMAHRLVANQRCKCGTDLGALSRELGLTSMPLGGVVPNVAAAHRAHLARAIADAIAAPAPSTRSVPPGD